MNNFRVIAHLDTFDAVAHLHKLSPHTWPPLKARGEVGSEMIGLGASYVLRGHKDITFENWLEDLPVSDTEELEKWPSMQRLLGQAKEQIMRDPLAGQFLTGEMGRAMVSRLDPGSTIFWHQDDGPYHEKHLRFHLPLVTNPGCTMYSRDESLHMPAGTLWWFNNRCRHSAANWGDFIRLHLIFEMRRP